MTESKVKKKSRLEERIHALTLKCDYYESAYHQCRADIEAFQASFDLQGIIDLIEQKNRRIEFLETIVPDAIVPTFDITAHMNLPLRELELERKKSIDLS